MFDFLSVTQIASARFFQAGIVANGRVAPCCMPPLGIWLQLLSSVPIQVKYHAALDSRPPGVRRYLRAQSL